MGFDPRRWQPPAARRAGAGRGVTANVQTLLAENDALRREVRSLRLQLEALLEHQRVTASPSHGLTAARLECWGRAMAAHSRWRELRIGSPGGLRGLIDELRSHWWNPQLSLEEELDRRAPGLGAELAEALVGPHSRARWAVRAAFALYGPRAMEWLDEDPLRVVDELLRRVGPAGRRRGTRTQNHSQAADARDAAAPAAEAEADPRREALRLLGLEPGASIQAIKRAYRRLAKAHHPDLGGDVEAFHRLDAAYRLLIGQG
jgi:hypothetical protein